jgi:nucleoside-diphosphate-sugar epimerase
MRVLVLGGSRFVGRAVVETAADQRIGGVVNAVSPVSHTIWVPPTGPFAA